MTKLEQLYQTIDSLRDLGLSLSDEILEEPPSIKLTHRDVNNLKPASADNISRPVFRGKTALAKKKEFIFKSLRKA